MSNKPELSPASEWKLDHNFVDADEEVIDCGEVSCQLGSYLIQRTELEDGSSELHSPACTTCEFAANLDEVFNDAEPRFTEGAPECFKREQHSVLTRKVSPPIDMIRTHRPDTAEIIDSYVS